MFQLGNENSPDFVTKHLGILTSCWQDHSSYLNFRILHPLDPHLSVPRYIYFQSKDCGVTSQFLDNAATALNFE